MNCLPEGLQESIFPFLWVVGVPFPQAFINNGHYDFLKYLWFYLIKCVYPCLVQILADYCGLWACASFVYFPSVVVLSKWEQLKCYLERGQGARQCGLKGASQAGELSATGKFQAWKHLGFGVSWWSATGGIGAPRKSSVVGDVKAVWRFLIFLCLVEASVLGRTLGWARWSWLKTSGMISSSCTSVGLWASWAQLGAWIMLQALLARCSQGRAPCTLEPTVITLENDWKEGTLSEPARVMALQVLLLRWRFLVGERPLWQLSDLCFFVCLFCALWGCVDRCGDQRSDRLPSPLSLPPDFLRQGLSLNLWRSESYHHHANSLLGCWGPELWSSGLCN